MRELKIASTLSTRWFPVRFHQLCRHNFHFIESLLPHLRTDIEVRNVDLTSSSITDRQYASFATKSLGQPTSKRDWLSVHRNFTLTQVDLYTRVNDLKLGHLDVDLIEVQMT